MTRQSSHTKTLSRATIPLFLKCWWLSAKERRSCYRRKHYLMYYALAVCNDIETNTVLFCCKITQCHKSKKKLTCFGIINFFIEKSVQILTDLASHKMIMQCSPFYLPSGAPFDTETCYDQRVYSKEEARTSFCSNLILEMKTNLKNVCYFWVPQRSWHSVLIWWYAVS